MKLIEKQDDKVVFSAEISDSLANTIRRYVNEIETLAVDEIEVHKNDSALYDETIAHRIGLVPLKAGKAEANLKLSVNKAGNVYSGDLKGADVVFDKIPLTTLNDGQEIELIAKAKLGKGSEHAKFAPGAMFYRNVTEITLDKQFLEEIKRICPDCEIKEKGDKIIVIDNKAKEICDVCEGLAEKIGKKPETEIKDELIITLESFGQLGIRDIMKKSVDALKKDLNEVGKKVGK